MSRLASFVHVDGVAYGPDDDVPADVAKRIVHPEAWAEAPEAAEEPTEAPPRSGAGSGLEAWKSYAEQVGVEVDEDASRDEIIAAVDAAAK